MSIRETVQLSGETSVQETVDEHGTKRWRKDGLSYRGGDLPAVVHSDGSMQWWKNGLLHRRYNLPFSVGKDGEVVSLGTVRGGNTPDEVVSVRYEGIEYSVPHWLLEGHETSREKSEV